MMNNLQLTEQQAETLRTIDERSHETEDWVHAFDFDKRVLNNLEKQNLLVLMLNPDAQLFARTTPKARRLLRPPAVQAAGGPEPDGDGEGELSEAVETAPPTSQQEPETAPSPLAGEGKKKEMPPVATFPPDYQEQWAMVWDVLKSLNEQEQAKSQSTCNDCDGCIHSEVLVLVGEMYPEIQETVGILLRAKAIERKLGL